jgi:NAD(P)-dependent dehydrogenase (short-subunit alcohol dehydrogenase family)
MGLKRFDGRTAIVTGAGGNPSLGRAHAMLLAARGARVVVNDIGSIPRMDKHAGVASAETVAAEIRALGGEAVADCHSVASEEGAAAIVQTALDAFGSIDILVNNAGIAIAAPFDSFASDDLIRHVDVNLMGAVWMCRAVWPHMRAQQYGRIVNMTSASMNGVKLHSIYGASKGGLFGLTRGLAAEGLPYGIKVNAVNPGAFTRMLVAQQKESSPMFSFARDNLPPELSSPAVAFLAHEDCPVAGECIDSVGGEIRRTFLAQTRGFKDVDLTIEMIDECWDKVMASADADLLPVGEFDPTEWDPRDYDPGQ